MSDTAAAPPLAWSRAFAATPAQAGEARRFLAGILNGYLLADDAILCLSEMAANAILHSDSRKPGGHFTVRAEMHAGWLRVEVHDDGGPWTVPPPGGVQHGHGLDIISQLARAWGITGGSDTGWTVWAEITCPWHPSTTSSNTAHPPRPNATMPAGPPG
jgi:serine/threonine-protein kinase RsbW